jgi:hypothetical protein
MIHPALRHRSRVFSSRRNLRRRVARSAAVAAAAAARPVSPAPRPRSPPPHRVVRLARERASEAAAAATAAATRASSRVLSRTTTRRWSVSSLLSSSSTTTTISPLLAALLRANPAQWRAAGEALASAAAASSARSSHRASRAFANVWAEAGFTNHARRSLPNLSGVVVMMLVGGGKALFPATAHCLEKKRAGIGVWNGNGGDGEKTATGTVASLPPAARQTERQFDANEQPDWRGALVENTLTTLRAIHLSFLFFPVIFTAPFLLSKLAGEWGDAAWYRLLRVTLERAGAAFIKWGQWASTRYDVFPAQLCRELEELQANAPEHSYAKTRQILERAYGGAEVVDQIFMWVDPTPIASGSIAQIHRAKLRAGVAEENGGGPKLGFQPRLLRAVGAGVELLASGEWRRIAWSMAEEWRNSAGHWRWNPGSFMPGLGAFVGGDSDSDDAIPNADKLDAARRDEGASASASSSGGNGADESDTRPESRRSRRARREAEARAREDAEGRFVAVKVRHPGVVEVLKRDFAILMWLANATNKIEFLAPFQLEHTVQQFGVHMLQQARSPSHWSPYDRVGVVNAVP